MTEARKDTGQDAIVNTRALEALMRARVPMVLMDARVKKARIIPGARTVAPDAGPEKVADVVGRNKEALIVTYCGNMECSLSHRLKDHLHDLGYRNVIRYAEGLEGWEKAGNPTETIA